MGVLHGTVLNALGSYLKGVACVDACSFGDQLVGAELQVAAGLQPGALRLAVAFGGDFVVAMAFEQAAQPIHTAGHRQATTALGRAAGRHALVACDAKAHLFGLHVQVARIGLYAGTVDL
ncbi:hypothetical protein D3C73_1258030 [compost metagenome]